MPRFCLPKQALGKTYLYKKVGWLLMRFDTSKTLRSPDRLWRRQKQIIHLGTPIIRNFTGHKLSTRVKRSIESNETKNKKRPNVLMNQKTENRRKHKRDLNQKNPPRNIVSTKKKASHSTKRTINNIIRSMIELSIDRRTITNIISVVKRKWNSMMTSQWSTAKKV